MKKHRLYILITHSICVLSLLSCEGRQGKFTSSNEKAKAGADVRYAQGFRIEKHETYTLADVCNPWNTQRILQRYILVPKSDTLPKHLPEGIVIRTPLERTVSYGSVQCSFFEQFDALPSLVGVCEPQYINIPFVREGIRSGRIADLGQSGNPDIEKIMLIRPEALFTSPIEGFGYGQAAKLGIPFIECTDYLESSPLGRAEWIRFLALFFEKEAMADSLFRETVSRYRQLCELADRTAHRPTVMTETLYRGIWYMPGGNSYIASLLRDAGADYPWKDDTSTGSIGLSFESVLEKAEKADLWLIKYNSSNDLTYESLAEENGGYTFFDAWKKRKIYVCNTGRVPYYEELPIHPDRVLSDLVGIFHPELANGYRGEYYERMRE